MTAPITSREELLVAGLEQLLAAVHADDPKREILVRIGDAIREAKALTAPAQGPRTPLDLSPNELNTLATDAFREAAQQSLKPRAYWIEHPKFGMELSLDPPNEASVQRGWEATPLYAPPSTGLPAPAPHHELADKIEAAKLALDTMDDGQPDALGPTEAAFFDLMEENTETIIAALRLQPAPAPHAEVREALGEQQIDILAKRVAGAELNYRNSYEQNGGDHIETGRNWDLMRRSGDAIRQHFYEREEDSQQDRGGK